jgi:hypothetical protein
MTAEVLTGIGPLCEAGVVLLVPEMPWVAALAFLLVSLCVVHASRFAFQSVSTFCLGGEIVPLQACVEVPQGGRRAGTYVCDSLCARGMQSLA